jgi:hypothetical protein
MLAGVEVVPSGKFISTEATHREAQNYLKQGKVEDAWAVLIKK